MFLLQRETWSLCSYLYLLLSTLIKINIIAFMPYKKRFQVTYKCVTLLSTSLLTSLWVLCTRAEQYNYLWWKFFPLPRSFRASKYHYRPDYRNLFTQEEYCNNPLKVICWFVLHIRKWYMPLRCIHSYSLHSYTYFTNVSIWECFCHIHVKYICVYIFCFIMKKQNQHANERSNIRSIYPLFPWKKYVYSMPFEKKKRTKKPQPKHPIPKTLSDVKSQHCKCKVRLQKHILLIKLPTCDFN